MPTVALVRLRYAPQEYWFDPNGIGAQEGDHVVVETSRGKEMGLCTAGSVEVDESEISKPLKPVLRVATESDLAKCDELEEKDKEGMRAFRELVEEHGLDMSPSAVEFLFDGSHACFYFTAEERVDFRALVRDLASRFHVRVDMRQIGVRDEARMLGGLGHCGQELCCTRTGGEFQPVSIRMAKEQDLPLNPTKISGVCGRLMCCLRYEFEAYKDFKSRAPKKNALIETPLGMGKVIEFDTPREVLRLRLEDGKTIDVPLDAMDTGGKEPKEGENLRPCHISQENFDRIIEELNHDATLAMLGEKVFSDDPNLADATARAGSVERGAPQRRRPASSETKSSGQPSRKRKKLEKEAPARDQRKRRRSVAASDKAETASGNEDAPTQGSQQRQEGGNGQKSKSRRRRSKNRGRSDSKPKAQETAKAAEGVQASKPRPGQHSSTVSGDAAPSSQPSKSSRSRRRRRRSGGKGGGQGSGGSGSGNTSETAGE